MLAATAAETAIGDIAGTSAAIAEDLGNRDYGFEVLYDDENRLLRLKTTAEINTGSPMPYQYHPRQKEADTMSAHGICMRLYAPSTQGYSNGNQFGRVNYEYNMDERRFIGLEPKEDV